MKVEMRNDLEHQIKATRASSEKMLADMEAELTAMDKRWPDLANKNRSLKGKSGKSKVKNGPEADVVDLPAVASSLETTAVEMKENASHITNASARGNSSHLVWEPPASAADWQKKAARFGYTP